MTADSHSIKYKNEICKPNNNLNNSLSLLEDLNLSAALWKREPISDDYFPSMHKAVLSISGNVYKQQEMEIDTALTEIESKYDSFPTFLLFSPFRLVRSNTWVQWKHLHLNTPLTYVYKHFLSSSFF